MHWSWHVHLFPRSEVWCQGLHRILRSLCKEEGKDLLAALYVNVTRSRGRCLLSTAMRAICTAI